MISASNQVRLANESGTFKIYTALGSPLTHGNWETNAYKLILTTLASASFVPLTITSASNILDSNIIVNQGAGNRVFEVGNAANVNIYNTYTDASNYERASLKWDSNIFEIASEALGTGSLREIEVFAATKTTFKSNNGSGYLELSGANTPYFTAFQSTGKRGAYGPLSLTFYDAGATNPVQLGKSDTVTTTSTTATTIVSFVTSFKGAKLVIQAADTVSGERQMSEILLVHDGTTVTLTEYGVIYTNASLATYTAEISGGNVVVKATSASTNSTTYKVMETLI